MTKKKTLIRTVATAACLGVLAGCIGPAPRPEPPASTVLTCEAEARAPRVGELKSALSAQQTADQRLHLRLPGFDKGRAVIKPDMAEELDKVAEDLRELTQARILVVGHTDISGSDPLNERLSQERAHNVRRYLAMRGLSEDRILTEGRGAIEPLADNATAAGQAQNRRIEIFVTDQGQG